MNMRGENVMDWKCEEEDCGLAKKELKEKT